MHQDESGVVVRPGRGGLEAEHVAVEGDGAAEVPDRQPWRYHPGTSPSRIPLFQPPVWRSPALRIGCLHRDRKTQRGGRGHGRAAGREDVRCKVTGLMQGFPPPREKTVRASGVSGSAFPNTRWASATSANWGRRTVRRGPGPPYRFPTGCATISTACSFTMDGGPMTWGQRSRRSSSTASSCCTGRGRLRDLPRRAPAARAAPRHVRDQVLLRPAGRHPGARRGDRSRRAGDGVRTRSSRTPPSATPRCARSWI